MRFKSQFVKLQLIKMIIIITTKKCIPLLSEFLKSLFEQQWHQSSYNLDAMCSITEEEKGVANSVWIWEPDPLN